MRGRRRTGWFVWGAVIAAAVVGVPSTASAGTYTVKSCAASTDRRSDAWVPSIRATEPIEAIHSCLSGTGGTDGDVDFIKSAAFRPILPPPPGTSAATTGRAAGLTLTAPVGATLANISYARRLQSTDPSWDMRLTAASQVIDDCVAVQLGLGCANPLSGTVSATLPAGTTSLDLAAWCLAATCPYTLGPAYSFGAAIYSSTVTVQDAIAPVVATPVATHLSDGWLTTNSAIQLSASDALGVEDLQVFDGASAATELTPTTCVDWSVTPCAEPLVGGKTTRTADLFPTQVDLPDGTRTITARAIDPAGNATASAPLAVKVDRSPPIATHLAGGGFGASQTRTLTWAAPTGGSPLVSARVQVCRVDFDGNGPASCEWSAAPATGPFTIDLPAVNSMAEVTVELTDQAGNVGSVDYGEVFERDAVAPSAPSIKLFGGTGPTRTFVVTSDAGDREDVVAIHPRLCHGTSCTDLTPVPWVGPSTIIGVTAPAPGDYRVEATLADRTGNLSAPGTATFSFSGAAAGIGSTIGLNGKSGQAMALTPILPPKLSGTTILVRGTVAPGSAAQVAVTIAGRYTNRKAFSASKPVTPAANGKFAVRLRLPAKLARAKGLLVTIAATPAPGFAAAVVRKRLKP